MGFQNNVLDMTSLAYVTHITLSPATEAHDHLFDQTLAYIITRTLMKKHRYLKT